MPSGRLRDDWTELAQILNYKTEEEMLVDMYCEQEMGFAAIGEKLGVAHMVVNKRLHAIAAARNDVVIRSRGGAVRKKPRALQDVSDAALQHPELITQTRRVHVSAVYKERRRRAKAREEESEVSTNSTVGTDG